MPEIFHYDKTVHQSPSFCACSNIWASRISSLFWFLFQFLFCTFRIFFRFPDFDSEVWPRVSWPFVWPKFKRKNENSIFGKQLSPFRNPNLFLRIRITLILLRPISFLGLCWLFLLRPPALIQFFGRDRRIRRLLFRRILGGLGRRSAHIKFFQYTLLIRFAK